MRVCIPATNVRGEGEADFVLGSSAVARSFMWVALNLGHVCAGPMCSGCASTYYLSPDATCKPCPDEGDMLRLKLLAAVPFALMMLGLYVAVSLALFRLEVTTGSPKNAAIRTALNESRKFCICFGLSFQMMASSASCMPSNLPSEILFLFKFTSFFNADPSVITYEACGERGYPFVWPLFLMVLALVLLALYGAIELMKHRQSRQEDFHPGDIGFQFLAEGQKVMHVTRRLLHSACFTAMSR